MHGTRAVWQYPDGSRLARLGSVVEGEEKEGVCIPPGIVHGPLSMKSTVSGLKCPSGKPA